MSKRCELTGVGPRSGNSISHSKRATRRRWLPNLKTKRIYIPEENRWITVRASASALKTLSKKGMASVQKMQ
ncbi:50S ribosomal protein L28, partial [bacterium F11]